MGDRTLEFSLLKCIDLHFVNVSSVQFLKCTMLYTEINTEKSKMPNIVVFYTFLQSVSWSLAEFRHNKIVQSPHENYFNVCRQHKEK